MSGPDYARIPLSLMRHARITPAAKLLYARLLLYAGRDGRCHPSHLTLAREIAVTDRQVRRLLRELSAYGLVEWDCASGRVSQYQVRDLIEIGHGCPTTPDADVRGTPDTDVLQKDVFENRSRKRRKNSPGLPAAQNAAGFGRVRSVIETTLNRTLTDRQWQRLSGDLAAIAPQMAEPQMAEVFARAIAKAPKLPYSMAWFKGTLRQHLWEREEQTLPPAVRYERMDPDEVDAMAEAFGG